MPWCEPCAKYFAPSALKSDGTCPQCGGLIDAHTVDGRITVDTLDLKKLAGKDAEKVPWHFKLLVFLLGVYLTWRIVELFS